MKLPLQKHSTPKILHTRITGSGPVVVLLHGFLSSSEYWERTIASLQKSHTVVAIDLLGFGRSPKPYSSKYDYAAHLASIHATLKAHTITAPFTLIGHSMGSLLALRYTVTHTQQVQQLVLTNMPVTFDPVEAANEFYRSRLVRLGLHPFWQYGVWSVFKTLVRLGIMPKRLRQFVNRRSKYIFQHTGISRLRSFRNVILNSTVRDDLAKVTIPTTLLSGTKDREIYFKNLDQLTLLANISTQSVDTGHHIPIVRPELIMASLTRL